MWLRTLKSWRSMIAHDPSIDPVAANRPFGEIAMAITLAAK